MNPSDLAALFGGPSAQPSGIGGLQQLAGLLGSGGDNPALKTGMGLLAAAAPTALAGSAVPRPMMGAGGMGQRPQMPPR